VVAVIAIVAGAGAVVLRSHSTAAPQSLPVLGGVPTFPQFSTQPSASPTAAPTRPGGHRGTTTHKKTGTGAPAQPNTTPATTAAAPAIEVAYKIDQRWNGGFQAEIEVVNNGSQPISNWQIAVALESDQFTSWWNATGYVSNGILLLYQASDEGPVAANGGTLHVYFDVSGSQTVPNACGFDGIACT
jgi:hypothetical protein